MADSKTRKAFAAAASLADPLRHALHSLVRRSRTPVSRDQAAEELGIARHLASFHLDRLHEAGLLEVEYRRPEGKTGPGAGRPAKYYRPAGELELSVPPRRYGFAASLLTRAIGRAEREKKPIGEALRDVAEEAGRQLAKEGRASAATLPDILDEFGYEVRADNGLLTLSNCPFRALADEDTELVCGMNLHLLSGLAEGMGLGDRSVRLEPAPGRCCVVMAGV